MRRRSFVVSLAVPVLASPLVSLLSGCDDTGKKSEAVAAESLDIVMPLIERDIGQVRKGVPEGAKVLAKKLPSDPVGSRQELQKAIADSRKAIDDLAFAKVTFFAFASPDGVVLRNETDPDRLVEQNVLQAFPALEKAKDAKSGMVEAFGEMDALRGVKKGPDLAWIVAHPIVPEGGAEAKGMLVTGWSMRLWLRGIEQQLIAKLGEQAKEKKQNNVPVAYVFLVKGGGVYADPDRADSLSEAIGKMDLVAKSASGDAKVIQEIDKRMFGVAARRVAALGDDAAIVVAASVF